MDASLKEQTWYLKQSKTAIEARGPYSTEQVVEYGQTGQLKDRVCISPDRQRWYSFGLPQHHKLSKKAIEKALRQVLNDCRQDQQFAIEAQLERQKWYLKSNTLDTKPQGPFSTKTILRYIVEQPLKDCVCISLDQTEWFVLGDLFPDRTFSGNEIKQKLYELSISSNRVPTILFPRRLSYVPKLYWLVPAAVVLLSVVMASVWYVLTRQESNTSTSRTSQSSPDRIKSPEIDTQKVSKQQSQTIPKKPSDVRPIDASQEVSKDKPKPETVVPPVSQPAEQETSKGTESKTPPEEPISKPSEAKPKDDSLPTEEKISEAKPKDDSLPGEEKISEAKPKDDSLPGEEKMLHMAMADYYQHLNDIGEELSQKRDIKSAFDLFDKRAKTVEYFAEQRGIKVINPLLIDKIRMANKNEVRFVFFYPAYLYEKYSFFLLAMDRKKMSQMEREIADTRLQLADDIKNKQELEQQQRLLTDTGVYVRKMQKNIEDQISSNARDITRNREAITDLQNKISRSRSRMSSASQESLDISEKIKEVYRQLEPKELIGYHPGMDQDKEELERKLRYLQKQRDLILQEIDTLQKDITRYEQEIRKIQKTIDQSQQEAPELEKQQKQLQKQTEDLTAKQANIENQLTLCREKLKPLDSMVKHKQQINQTAAEIERWWSATNPKPRKNFLVATYILDKFSPQYYQTSPKKDVGFGGVIEVYFW